MIFRFACQAAIAGAVFLVAPVSAGAATLGFCTPDGPRGFDPALYSDAATLDASSRTVYNRLVEHRRGTTEIESGLAQSWEISDNGLEYTFTLREGVRFHEINGFAPTRPLNADDVVFSLERQRNVGHPWYSYRKGADWEVFKGRSLREIIKRTVKVDERTVKIELRRPHAPLLSLLAMDFASILSAEYAAQLDAAGQQARLDEVPSGTGPFVFSAHQKDEAVRYTKNETYWAGAPAIDELSFVIVPEADDRLRKLKDGECQVMAAPARGDLAAIRADDALTLKETAAADLGYLAFNTKTPPFDNRKVRKALSLAIDRSALVDAVYAGAAEAADGVLPPSSGFLDPFAPDPVHDPELARRLLDDAGVSDLRLKIWALPVARAYIPDGKALAGEIKEQLEKIGVGVDIVGYNWGAYLAKSKAANRDGAVMFGWTAAGGDPDAFLTAHLTCGAAGALNRANWCNELFDARIDAARTSTDPKERLRLYREAQSVLRSSVPVLPIAHSLRRTALSKSVSGYTSDPLGGHWFDRLSVSE